mgnify:CR=1 FL=1
MEEPIHNILPEDYVKNVQWLRDHVPRDDVYDFAQQTIMAGEYFIARLHEVIDLPRLMVEDEVLAFWVQNICSLQRLKDENFTGILNVCWKAI